MSQTCHELKFKINVIKSQKIEFDRAYSRFSPNLEKQEKRKVLDESGEIKDKLEINISNLEQYFNGIIPKALNPYREAFFNAGITDLKDNPIELEDAEMDLDRVLKQDKQAYLDAGAVEWANDVPDDIKDLNLTQDQIDLLKSRIEKGEIPVFMPGRLAQIRGLLNAMKRLKPVWIEKGQEQEVYEADILDFYERLIEFALEIAENPKMNKDQKNEIIEKIREVITDDDDPEKIFDFVHSIPKNPYVFTSKPCQLPEPWTVGWTDIKLPFDKEQVLSIGEYLALQNRFTHRLKEEFENRGAGNPEKLDPLDIDSSIRFIDLPITKSGSVPCVGFDYQLTFSSGFDLEYMKKYGFRCGTRI